jgi:hypothetical protein
MEKTLQEKLKEQGTQGSVLLADTYEFGSLNGFTEVSGDTNRNITGELLEKIIQWHKNPNKIFLVLDFAHSNGPSTTYGKLCFSKYNWQGYSNSKPYYMAYTSNYKVSLYLNVDMNTVSIDWTNIL